MPNPPDDGNNPIKPSTTSSTSLQFDKLIRKSPTVQIETRQVDEKLFSFENVEFQIFSELYSNSNTVSWTTLRF